MPVEQFTINVPWTFPVGTGVVFMYDVDREEKRVHINGYGIVPINADTVFASEGHVFVCSHLSPSGRFPIAYFDRQANPDRVIGEVRYDLRHRYLAGHGEDYARDWAEGFAEDWNEKWSDPCEEAVA